ncbi:unnamed protein product [Ectocarpus sp. 6 AP-2014]
MAEQTFDKKRRLDEDGNASAFAENTAESRKEKLETWLKPLDNEQLVKLLLDIGSVNPGAFDEIHRACDDIPVNKKIFVRGLPWETNDQSLRAVFEQYGEIAEATVVMDKMTQKSKGYGFVTFKSMDGAHAALENPEKMIDGRVSLCNLAALRSSQPLPARAGGGMQGGAMQGGAGGMMGGAVGGSGEDVSARKIFVRGLSWDTTTESLRTMFSQFGELEDCVVTTDRASGKSKGYGFVTFRFAANAAAAVAEPEKQLDGRLTHCNIAAEGASNRKNQNYGGPQAGQHWGMMGQQQQYPAQGQGSGQWGVGGGDGQAQGFGGQGQWGQQQQFGAPQGVQQAYGNGAYAGGAAAYGTNGGGAYQGQATQAAGGAGAWGGQQGY